MIVRLLRDNTFLNPIVRIFVPGLVKISNRLKWVAHKYRIYGNVHYEYEVLLGAVETLSSKKPLLLLEILNYDKLIEQFPKMEYTLDSNYANRVESLLSSIGYYAYQLKPSGVEFVDTIANAHGSRNFLFATKLVSGRIIRYSQLAETFSSYL